MDRIKNDILKKLQELSDDSYERAALNLRNQLEDRLPQIRDSFERSMGPVLERFSLSEENKRNGALEWVYISYLRSGILLHSACYRIDCYDCRDRISNEECAGTWDFSYIHKPFLEAVDKLKTEFGRQSRVKKYELDALVFDLGERFFLLAKEFIPSVAEEWTKEYGRKYLWGQRVSFMAGEFLDHAGPVLLWDRDHIGRPDGQ